MGIYHLLLTFNVIFKSFFFENINFSCYRQYLPLDFLQQINRCIRWRYGGRGRMDYRGGTWVDIFSGNTVRGHLQAPEVRLHRTAEVTLIRVGICAPVHLRQWGCLCPSGTSTEG